MRSDGRPNDQLRPIQITRNFTDAAAGSVLWQQGKTIVWCTASITPDVPPWFGSKKPGGWITADYVMLPGSTPRRKDWPAIGHTDSRGTEIQRLIGRSIRAAVDLNKIGPHTIHIDCQVMQADGGTRTASICGAYVALFDAVSKLPAEVPQPKNLAPGALVPARFEPANYDPTHAIVTDLAGVSVGLVDGEIRLDLDYDDDSRAQVDMNVAYTSAGKFVEVQGSAENAGGFDRAETDRMLDLAVTGCKRIIEAQRRALANK